MKPKIISAIDLISFLKAHKIKAEGTVVKLVNDSEREPYLIIRPASGDTFFMKLNPELDDGNLTVSGRNACPSNQNSIPVVKSMERPGGYVLFISNADNVLRVNVCDRLNRIISRYSVRGNSSNILCGNGLCLTVGKKENIALTPNGYHPMVKGLTPLMYCKGDEYYVDIGNKLLVRYDGNVLTPLTNYSFQYMDCMDKGVICLSDGRDVHIIEEGASYDVAVGEVKKLHCYKDIVLTGKEGRWSLYILSKGISSDFFADECILSNGGFIYCISRGILVSVDPYTGIDEYVRKLRGVVTSKTYAVVEVSPWGPMHNYKVSGPVKIVSTFQAGDTLKMLLRPMKLGWSGEIFVNVESPLYMYNGKISLTSSKPVISNISIDHCMFAPTGNIVGESSNSITALKFNVLRTTPEKYTLIIRGHYVDVVKTSFKISSAGDEDLWLVNIKGRIGSEGINSGYVLYDIRFKSSFEEFLLSRLMLPLSKCVKVNEPVSKIKAFRYGNNLKIKTSNSNFHLKVYCLDSFFEGVGSVTLDKCTLPIVVEEIKRRGMFEWVSHSLLQLEPLLNLHESEKPKYETAVKSTDNEIDVHIPKKPPRQDVKLHGVLFEKIREPAYLIKISTGLPALSFIVCGEKSYISMGSEVLKKIHCPIFKALNGVYVYTLYPGLPAEKALGKSVINGVQAFREILISGVKAGNELRRVLTR